MPPKRQRMPISGLFGDAITNPLRVSACLPI
jgi:hypothetical protein